ncbi:PA4642 family protein [Marinobacter sp. 1Y8]
MSGPDKPKVIGEEWSDERVKSFLFITPYDKKLNPDYQVLIKAYQAMRAGDFERFLAFFTEVDRDLNALGADGQTMLDHVSEHRRGVEYVEALKKYGAQSAASQQA